MDIFLCGFTLSYDAHSQTNQGTAIKAWSKQSVCVFLPKIKVVACDTVESASCNMTAGRLFPHLPQPEQPVNSLLSLSMNILNLNT